MSSFLVSSQAETTERLECVGVGSVRRHLKCGIERGNGFLVQPEFSIRIAELEVRQQVFGAKVDR